MLFPCHRCQEGGHPAQRTVHTLRAQSENSGPLSPLGAGMLGKAAARGGGGKDRGASRHRGKTVGGLPPVEGFGGGQTATWAGTSGQPAAQQCSQAQPRHKLTRLAALLHIIEVHQHGEVPIPAVGDTFFVEEVVVVALVLLVLVVALQPTQEKASGGGLAAHSARVLSIWSRVGSGM